MSLGRVQIVSWPRVVLTKCLKKPANFLGFSCLITTKSGSSANLIAFSTLTSPELGDRAIRAGDDVISVAAGFPTIINPVPQFGAVPIFVDVDIVTHNIDASKIEWAIGSKTRAVMLAHALGNPFSLEMLMSVWKKYNLWLIEDTCDVLGAKFDDHIVGTFGDTAPLSFYPAHHYGKGWNCIYQ